MIMRYKFLLVIAFTLFLSSCADEAKETVPAKPLPLVDTLEKVKSKPKDNIEKSIINPYLPFEKKILEHKYIEGLNAELVKKHKPKLISKIIDNKQDSLFSIKLGEKVDTAFLQKFEFFINKKTKQISVYDVGEDRLIPISEWNEELQ